MRIPIGRLLSTRSPLPRIGIQMQRAVQCAEMVPELIDALIEGNKARIAELAKLTSQLESAADDAKNEVRDNLPTRLFLPVDRRDLLRLLAEIDAIADCAEDIGVLLTLRHLEVPGEMKELLRLFVRRVIDAVKAAADLVDRADSLLSSGFSGRSADEVRGMIEELARKEHEADKLQDQLAKELFVHEDALAPVAVFMWTKVLNKIGDLANHAENVGDQFRLFIAHS